MRKITFIVLIIFIMTLDAGALSLYVSSTGKDTNPGNMDAPFLTVKRAKDYVQTLLLTDPKENIDVFIEKGNYYIDQPLAFTQADSPLGEYEVIYQGMQNPTNDIPVLCGGKQISSWNKYNSMVYFASIINPEFTILFENNKPCRLKSSAAALDTPGDFFLDKTGKLLYFIPYNLPINLQEIWYPVLDSLIIMQGADINSKVRNLKWKRTAFMVPGRKESQPAAVPAAGTLSIVLGENITVTDCRFIYSGDTGLFINKTNKNIFIRNNRIENFNSYGIYLTNLPVGNISSPDFSGSVIIENNIITNKNFDKPIFSAVHMNQTAYSRIRNNDIFGIKGNGINLQNNLSIDYFKGINNIVENNQVYNLTPSNEILYGIGISNTREKNIISHNRVFNLDGRGLVDVKGLYLYKADFTEIKNNMIHTISNPDKGSVIELSGRNITLTHNIFAGNEVDYDIYFPNTGVANGNYSITRNLFDSLHNDYVYLFYDTVFPDSSIFDFNVYNHNSNDYYVQSFSTRYDWSMWKRISGLDKNSVIDINPLFIEPQSLNFIPSFDNSYQDINTLAMGVKNNHPFRYASDRLEAEKATQSYGPINMTTNMAFNYENEYIVFSSIYFESPYLYMDFRYTADASVGFDLRSNLEIRLDSITGPLVGSFKLTGTGNGYITGTGSVNKTIGFHDLYVIIKGGLSTTLKLDWIQFTNFALPQIINEPPGIEIEGISNNQVVFINTESQIHIKGYDNDGIVSSIDLIINDQLKTRSYGSILDYTWKMTQVGTFVVKVFAFDNKGLAASKTVTLFVVEKTSLPPDIAILSPKSGEVFSGSDIQSIVITAKINFKTSPIRHIEFLINDSVYMIFNKESNVPYEYSWRYFQPGEYEIKVKADNIQGLISISKVNIFIDSKGFIKGHWPFDQYGSNVAVDVSELKNDGDILNCFSINGVKGGALQFDGNGGVFTNSSILNGFEQFTIAGWINPQETGLNAGLWGQNGVIEFGFNGKNVLHLFTQPASLDVPYLFPLNEWHHAAAMSDGTRLYIYIDGNLVGENTCYTSNFGTSSGTFNIGSSVFSQTGGNFKGAIDDVIIYNKKISIKELKELARKDNNILPSVKIKSPLSGQKINGPSDILVKVEASDPDSGIKRVEFYANDEYIGNVEKPPYNFQWSSVVPHSYSLKAKVIDNQGGEGIDVVLFTVILTGETLLGYWNFDDQSPVVAYDHSANNNHGKILNGRVVKGVRNSAIAFNGDGYVEVAAGLLNNLSQFTMAGWIKPVKTGSRIGLWGQHTLVEFGFITNGSIQIYTPRSGMVTTNYPFRMNEWHHIAAVLHGRGLLIYFDGKPVEKVETYTSSYGESPWTFNIGGGGIFDSTGNFFSGSIDEVYLFSRALSEEEIAGLCGMQKVVDISVVIKEPGQGAIFENPGEIVISADAQAQNCPITRVEFYADYDLLYTGTKAPFVYVWKPEQTNKTMAVQIKAVAYGACEQNAEEAVSIMLYLTAPAEEEEPGTENILPGFVPGGTNIESNSLSSNNQVTDYSGLSKNNNAAPTAKKILDKSHEKKNDSNLNIIKDDKSPIFSPFKNLITDSTTDDLAANPYNSEISQLEAATAPAAKQALYKEENIYKLIEDQRNVLKFLLSQFNRPKNQKEYSKQPIVEIQQEQDGFLRILPFVFIAVFVMICALLLWLKLKKKK